jgi:quercetin dioxygenase-like cupin family protein
MVEPKAPRVRRIVTGHDASGRAVLVADEELTPRGLAGSRESGGASFFQVWATQEMPVHLTNDALERQRWGSDAIVVGNGEGSTIRIGVIPPGFRSPMHRTVSLDYGICLDGECDLELDGGDRVTVRARDVVIQRGTNHAWHNRSQSPCRFAWILLDARPFLIDGKSLRSTGLDEER